MTRDQRTRAVRVLAVALIGAAAGLAAVAISPPASGAVGPGSMTLRVLPTMTGTSSLALPPFGRVTADTHDAPLRFELRVEQLDVESLQRLLGEAEPEVALRSDVEHDLRPLLVQLSIRSLVAALLGGILAGAVLPRRAAHRFAVAGGSATVVMLLFLTVSWATYDTDAFTRARFIGPLERAPAILEAAQKHVRGLADVRDRVEGISQQVAAMYAAVEQEPVSGETTILHVSDVHSNPLGLEIAQQLARTFDADAVLDTGDLTSFGHPVESRLTEMLDGFEIPYLFVPGNHDAPSTRAAIAATAGVTLLDSSVIEIEGVRIYGVADPTFTATNEIDTKEGNQRRLARAGLVADQVRRTRPDILAVHDIRLGSESPGLVPVIASGHTHKRSAELIDNTLVLEVGSTGATGLGAFTIDTNAPYEAELLRFDGLKLVAVDYVTLDGVSGEFRVERRLVEDLFEPPPVERFGPQ